MSITETEAKRICRQSGAYCEQEALGSHRYGFTIAAKCISGFFEVENDRSVHVEYGLKDPINGFLFGSQTRAFDDAGQWAAFWTELQNEGTPDALFSASFDPSNDDLEKTEAEREQRVRVGQGIYRQRLEELWNGACAVTGIKQKELLRASHAKPWAECNTGAERLSPYNGFLLNVAMDALFDKFLISFDASGLILISKILDPEELRKLGINQAMRLRTVYPQHLPFVEWHRQRFSELQDSVEGKNS